MGVKRRANKNPAETVREDGRMIMEREVEMERFRK